MTTQVILTLNSPVGGSVGPILTLTADVGVVVPNTATVTQLLAGFIVTIDTLATIISATSSGECTIIIPFIIPATTTTTSTTSTTTTTTTTTLCPCNSYFFYGASPVSSFTFRECEATSNTTIGLGDRESDFRCVDNAYPISVIGSGTYIIYGDLADCCTPTTSTTTTSTTSTTSTTTTTTALYCGDCYSLYVTEFGEGFASFKYTNCNDEEINVTVSNTPIQVCSKTIPVIINDGNKGAGVYASGLPCNNDCSPDDKACLCYTAVNYLGVSNILYYRPCGTTTGAYATHVIPAGGSWTVCASGPVFFGTVSGSLTPIYFGGICDINNLGCDPVIPTTTTTSTTADPYNIKVYNYTNTGSITSVVGGIGAFYIIGEGFFPIPANSHVFGTHGNYTGIIKVKIVDTYPGHITLYVGVTQIGCINTTGSGEYTFPSHVYNTSDIITVTYSVGSC